MAKGMSSVKTSRENCRVMVIEECQIDLVIQSRIVATLVVG